MVVKKKRTYKKQKGGLVIPDKLSIYLNFVREIISSYYNCSESREYEINLVKKGLFENINSIYMSYKSENILIKNLAEKLFEIYSKQSNIQITNIVSNYIKFISDILRCILLDVF